MIDRNRYLKLCQQNSVYPNSVEVEVDGVRYRPNNLVIWFDRNGKTQNTAHLIEIKSLSGLCAKLEEVNEV